MDTQIIMEIINYYLPEMKDYICLPKGVWNKIKIDFSKKYNPANPTVKLDKNGKVEWEYRDDYIFSALVHVQETNDNGFVVGRIENSVHEKGGDSKPGIGLDNVRKRLDLIYGSNYELHIDKTSSSYCVTLKIPTLNGDEVHSN